MSARAQTCEMLRTLRQLWALGYELHQNAFPYMTRARDPARLRNWSAAPGPIASGWLRKFPGQYTERHLQKQQQRRHVVRGGAASGADVAAGEPRRRQLWRPEQQWRRRGRPTVPLPRRTWALATELVDLGYRLDFLTYSANIVARRPRSPRALPVRWPPIACATWLAAASDKDAKLWLWCVCCRVCVCVCVCVRVCVCVCVCVCVGGGGGGGGAAASAAAAAGTPPPPPPPSSLAAISPPASALFRAIDADGDGKLSLAEFEAAARNLRPGPSGGEQGSCGCRMIGE